MATLSTAGAVREQNIKEYDALMEAWAAAKKEGDKSLCASLSAQASRRSSKIHNAELDMAMEGEPFEPWVKPDTAGRISRRAEVSEEEIVEQLKKAGNVYHDPDRAEITKVTADQRITALLKQAKSRGYSVKDPRKS